jgi:hypothetical protein
VVSGALGDRDSAYQTLATTTAARATRATTVMAARRDGDDAGVGDGPALAGARGTTGAINR